VGAPPSGPAPYALAFSPNGKRLAIGFYDLVKFVKVATRQEVGPVLAQGGPVQSVSFSPDGKFLATAGSNGRTRLWDATTGLQIGPALSAGGASVYAVAFSPDGATLATASFDGMAQLWGVGFPADLPRVMCAIAGNQSLSYQQWHALTPAPYRRECR
jgi:WD40 repeat protein